MKTPAASQFGNLSHPIPGAIPQVVRFEGLATLESAREAAIAVRSCLEQSGFSEEETGAWELLLCEVLNNLAVHAGMPGRAPVFEVKLSVFPGRVEARVTDDSPGFEWPEVISLPSFDAESGRGLFLIKTL